MSLVLTANERRLLGDVVAKDGTPLLEINIRFNARYFDHERKTLTDEEFKELLEKSKRGEYNGKLYLQKGYHDLGNGQVFVERDLEILPFRCAKCGQTRLRGISNENLCYSCVVEERSPLEEVANADYCEIM